MPYSYDPIFAVDPANSANIAKNAAITIFDPADPSQAPIAITDPTGSPLPNPITVDAAGMAGAFQHPTLARVGWKGAGFVGYFTSYEGMYNETVAAKEAAQAAIGEAEAAAADRVTTATVNGAGKLILSKAGGETIEAGSVVGPKGEKGEKGVDGGNVLPTQQAIEQAIINDGPAKMAIAATIVTATADKVSAVPAIKTPRPLVSFTFDDGFIEDLTAIKPILDAKAIKGVFAINSGYVGTSGAKLSWAQVKQLRDEGHEIVDHSWTHVNLNTTDATILAAQMDASKAAFNAQGIYPTGFCWPQAASNATSRRVARKLYKYALGGAAGSTMPLHTYAIKRVEITNASALATHTAQIDAAITNNEFLIFLVHSPNLDATGLSILGQVIDYAKSKTAATIVTTQQGFDLVGNVMDTGDLPGGADYSVIDGQGRPASSGGILVQGTNNATAATTPVSFAAGKITRYRVSGPGNTDYPNTGGAVNVEVNRLDTSSPVYTVQHIYTSSGAMFSRRALTDTTWGAWIPTSPVVVLANNAITVTSTPASFEQGKITRGWISTPNNQPANGWPITGGALAYEVDRAGTDTNTAYITQRITGPNGMTLTRRASGDTTWGPWHGSATMAARPAANTFAAGAMIYDTALGKPVWSTGSAWVDATGATV